MRVQWAAVVLVALAMSEAPGNRASLSASRSETGGATAAPEQFRKHGFVFVELDCRNLAEYIGFFKGVGGFQVERTDGGFVVLHSARGEILLNEKSGQGRLARFQGPRVEIGIVVDDLDGAYAHARACKAWTLAADIVRRPWGVRDFRVYSPEGYYFRITEAPK